MTGREIANGGLADFIVETGPETVNLELTLRCNLNCKMCQRSFRGFRLPEITDMTLTTVKNVLPLLARTKLVWLSGFGEPLLHPDLLPIIRLIRSVNPAIETAFTTNFLLVKGEKLKGLIEAGLTRIQVSVDGDNELGHSFFPTPEGVARYQQVLWERLEEFHNLKQELGKSNPELQFCFVGMRRNIHQLEEIIQRGLTVGLSSIVVQPVRDYDGSLTGEDLFENRNYALPILTAAKKFAEQQGVGFICRFMDDKMSVTRQKCTFPRTFFHVAVDGSVFMCCEGIPAGHNVATDNALDIWNSAPYLELRKELAGGRVRRKCWDCPLVKPTTDNERVIGQELMKLDAQELAGEIMEQRRYIESVNARESWLLQETAAEKERLLGDIKLRDSLLIRTKALMEQMNRCGNTLSADKTGA
jgi:MoaA/NifB/PqqE/SkfB family radical SAM enzyme